MTPRFHVNLDGRYKEVYPGAVKASDEGTKIITKLSEARPSEKAAAAPEPGSVKEGGIWEADDKERVAAIKNELAQDPKYPVWTAETFNSNFELARRGAQHLVKEVLGGSWELFEEMAKNLADDARGL